MDPISTKEQAILTFSIDDEESSKQGFTSDQQNSWASYQFQLNLQGSYQAFEK